MNDEMKFQGFGVYLYGALYLVGVFVAGLAYGNRAAVFLSISAAGVVYLAQVAGFANAAGAVKSKFVTASYILAVLTCAIAGLSLLGG